MWFSYEFGEVSSYHPICERALKNALRLLSKDGIYEVLHHQHAGSLEMDYVIRNKHTMKYLSVFEVKRTPSDVHSLRYQYQAMSYIQMLLPETERQYYVLTNLECSFAFRYDSSRPRVVQQMIDPGQIHIGKFNDSTQAEFEERLTIQFASMLDDFINDRFRYSVTLEQFTHHMELINSNPRLRKSSLAILMYEYIRGAFAAVGRRELIHDVRMFNDNVEQICNEANRVNFKEIFTYDGAKYEPSVNIDNSELSNFYRFGNQNITADSVAEILHQIASSGHEHTDGEVPTDLELARFVAVLAKFLHGDLEEDEKICDPAAGSGNLISSAVDIFNLVPNMIKVNDINPYLIELLSLRLGLLYPNIISRTNSAEISVSDMADLPKDFFNNTGVVLLNPPFVAGINCVDRKDKFVRKIISVTGHEPITNIGQISLEGLFLELLCDEINEGTVVSCIISKTFLMSRGPEAVAIRRMLLSKFGLSIIFTYPMDGLFEEVVKGTCVIVGKKGDRPDQIKIISSYDKISDINLHEFTRALEFNTLTDDFNTLIPGVEAKYETRANLLTQVHDGWRGTSSEMSEAIGFVKNNIVSNTLMDSIENLGYELPRGRIGNNGGSDLLFITSNRILYEDNIEIIGNISKPGMRNSRYSHFYVNRGDAEFLDVRSLSDDEVLNIIDYYMSIPQRVGRQVRLAKTREEYLAILRRESNYITTQNSILIPRAIRRKVLAYLLNEPTYVSTNFMIIENLTERNAVVLSTWMNTIFYQLTCEVSSKDQEGVRKMEQADIKLTYAPKIDMISEDYYNELVPLMNDIQELDLSNPIERSIDVMWAIILFGDEAVTKIDEAKRLLSFLVNKRNRQ